MPTLQYTYNGDGQRVQTVESGVTKKQVWDEENILLETDGSDVTQVVYTQEPAGYGNLLSQRRGSTTSYYLFDALGSTRRLASSAGSATDTYEYRAYGEPFSSTGSTINVFRWVGQLGYYYDIEREAYYVRARHYSPKQGRWISQDPLGFEGSEWNLYDYADDNPTNIVDSTGKKANPQQIKRCQQELDACNTRNEMRIAACSKRGGGFCALACHLKFPNPKQLKELAGCLTGCGGLYMWCCVADFGNGDECCLDKFSDCVATGAWPPNGGVLDWLRGCP